MNEADTATLIALAFMLVTVFINIRKGAQS